MLQQRPDIPQFCCRDRPFPSKQRLYDFVDGDGAAKHMVFWDEREGGCEEERRTREKRTKFFRGPNGLFFTLMVLRTALPLVVLSTLFGVHETTGGGRSQPGSTFSIAVFSRCCVCLREMR